MVEVATRPLFRIEFQTTPQILGDVPAGYFRRVGVIGGGRFEGERLRGKALPGGGDWLFRRTDGVIHIDVRAMLETDQGQTIYMTYGGRLKMPSDGEARLARGESLGINDIYFRTLVQFETAAKDLLWLNDIVAVGLGERHPTGPVYHVHELI